ncbi:MAG: autotransporter outer membrane beta-barrel domain-containing protein [Enterobacteriaceae bacterium]|jgi:outer membrane autotransporter protein|nr:autotransporter outer membrane beta-barrel domain-containing protein [Enterobacteriaceae bacterium]
MKIYKRSVLSQAIRIALFFSGISVFSGISANAIAGINCGTQITGTETNTCDLKNGESLTINKNSKIDVSGDTQPESSAINVGPSVKAGVITVDQGGELDGGYYGVHIDDQGGSLDQLINKGDISTKYISVYVNGQLKTLTNSGHIYASPPNIKDNKSTENAIVYDSSNLKNPAIIDTQLRNENGGVIQGVKLNNTKLGTIENEGTVSYILSTGLYSGDGNILDGDESKAAIDISTNSVLNTLTNKGIITAPQNGKPTYFNNNDAIIVRSGGQLENLDNYKEISAHNVAILAGAMGGGTIGTITNHEGGLITGGSYGIYIPKTGDVTAINNKHKGRIYGKLSGIYINGKNTDSIDNSGEIASDSNAVKIGDNSVVKKITNQANGLIQGASVSNRAGVAIAGKITDSIDNFGKIIAGQGIFIDLTAATPPPNKTSASVRKINNYEGATLQGYSAAIEIFGKIEEGIFNSGVIINDIASAGYVGDIENYGEVVGDIFNTSTVWGNVEYKGIMNNIRNFNKVTGYIGNGELIKGSIYNSGTINGNIINVHTGTIEGGIYNSGTVMGSIINSIDKGVIGIITDGIHNSGTIGGDVVLGNVNLYMSGPNATVNGAISGTKDTVVTISDGTSTLKGQSTQFDGATHVEGGTLALINKGTLGSKDSTLNVKGGSLSGNGTIGGSATIENGGLTNQHGGLTFNRNLLLQPETNVDVSLGGEGEFVPSLFHVNGDLTLAGSLNVKNLEQAAAGEYDIFHYGGKLTDNKMTITGGYPGFFLDTSTDKRVYLTHNANLKLNWWHGGSGLWQLGSDPNWTPEKGGFHYGWSNTDQFAIFKETAGTIRVNNSNGKVMAHGLQFITDGYVITGDPLTLVNNNDGGNWSSIIRVGAGNPAAANMVARIDAKLTGETMLEKRDPGTLILTSDSDYSLGTKITDGVLQLGNGTSTGNILNKVDISAEGTLAFNRSDNFTFDNPITGQGNLAKTGANTLTLAGANSYSGTTDVQQGTLLQGNAGAFSAHSNFITRPGSVLNLGGDNTTLAQLDNGGTVLFGGDEKAAGRTLTINGDYKGSDGIVKLSTVLGGDNSVTDKLVVNGNATGRTLLDISNDGGKGAFTQKGIEVVNVKGTSDAEFSLRPDYIHKGVPVIVLGAYAYHLEKDSDLEKAKNLESVVTPESDTNFGPMAGFDDVTAPVKANITSPVKAKDSSGKTGEKWYLASSSHQAGVGLYESYGRILQTLNAPVSLSNRIAAHKGNLQDATGFDPAVGEKNTEGRAGQLTGGVWGQITGSYGKLSPRVSTSGVDNITHRMGRAQVGIDRSLYESEQGSVVGGVFAQYSQIDADVDAKPGNGSIKGDSYTVGGTGTWFGNNGVYLDGLAQVTYFNNELDSKTANNSLKDKKAFGYAFSVETGKQIELTPAWSLTPQAQLTYSAIDMDEFDDAFDAKITFNQSRSAKLRVGTTLNYGQKWRDDKNQKEKAANFYGLVNVRQELLARNDSVNVAGTSFHGSNDRTWGEVGAGGSYSWNEGKYLVYSQATANTSLNNFADNYELGGKIGLRVAW